MYERPNLVVINSNLATPTNSYGTHTLHNPMIDDHLGPLDSFQGPKAFEIPEVIKLRLFDGSPEPLSDDPNNLYEVIRRLGHGVTAFVSRDETSALVSLDVVYRKRAARPNKGSLGWAVCGLARIPYLDNVEVEINAVRIAGHRTGATGHGSRISLFKK